MRLSWRANFLIERARLHQTPSTRAAYASSAAGGTVRGRTSAGRMPPSTTRDGAALASQSRQRSWEHTDASTSSTAPPRTTMAARHRIGSPSPVISPPTTVPRSATARRRAPGSGRAPAASTTSRSVSDHASTAASPAREPRTTTPSTGPSARASVAAARATKSSESSKGRAPLSRCGGRSGPTQASAHEDERLGHLGDAQEHGEDAEQADARDEPDRQLDQRRLGRKQVSHE